MVYAILYFVTQLFPSQNQKKLDDFVKFPQTHRRLFPISTINQNDMRLRRIGEIYESNVSMGWDVNMLLNKLQNAPNFRHVSHDIIMQITTLNYIGLFERFDILIS